MLIVRDTSRTGSVRRSGADLEWQEFTSRPLLRTEKVLKLTWIYRHFAPDRVKKSSTELFSHGIRFARFVGGFLSNAVKLKRLLARQFAEFDHPVLRPEAIAMVFPVRRDEGDVTALVRREQENVGIARHGRIL